MRRVICVFLILVFTSLPGGGDLGRFTAKAEVSCIVQVSAGCSHALALSSDGSLYTWGDNTFYQLGDGTLTSRFTPTLIGTGYTAISAGRHHSLALKGSALYAWGLNSSGQLGNGTRIACSAPTLIGTGYTAIAAGSDYSLALKGSALNAWGDNGYGQLGDSTITDRYSPTLIGTGYTAISAGRQHSLALKGNTLYAWGDNAAGQLGNGTADDKLISTLIDTRYSSIAAGSLHSLALKSSELYAWGDNAVGELGDGTTTARSTPTPIGTGYTAIDAGINHTLVLKGSALYAWGSNGAGQLGDGTTATRDAPILIGTGYTAISAGWYFSLAIKNGELYAWGLNEHGQLGDGTATDHNTPARIVFPAPPTTDPLYIYRFCIRNANLSIGDKAVFTAETGMSVNQARLYDQDGRLIASTKSYKRKGDRRIWTFSPVMVVSGAFRYWAVAGNGSGAGAASADAAVIVNTASLEVMDFTINSPAQYVGETVTFKLKTGKLANKVSILDASNVVFASSVKPSKTTNTQKTWLIQRKLTEGDMGSLTLHAQVGSIYGTGPASATQILRVTDNLPRIISVVPDLATVRRGAELHFMVTTNAASTNVWVFNDKCVSGGDKMIKNGAEKMS